MRLRRAGAERGDGGGGDGGDVGVGGVGVGVGDLFDAGVGHGDDYGLCDGDVEEV